LGWDRDDMVNLYLEKNSWMKIGEQVAGCMKGFSKMFRSDFCCIYPDER
jgi:hypothetical protein